MCAVVLLFLMSYRIGPRAIAQALGLATPRRALHDGGKHRFSSASKLAGARGGSAAAAVRGSKCCGPPGSASLIWVMLGDPHFQPYLMESIKQARIFNPTEYFFVVVDARHFNDTHPWAKQMDDLDVSMDVVILWSCTHF